MLSPYKLLKQLSYSFAFEQKIFFNNRDIKIWLKNEYSWATKIENDTICIVFVCASKSPKSHSLQLYPD